MVMMTDIEQLVEAIKQISAKDYWDYIFFIVSVITTVITTLINVWLVNKNTNKQIENQKQIKIKSK